MVLYLISFLFQWESWCWDKDDGIADLPEGVRRWSVTKLHLQAWDRRSTKFCNHYFGPKMYVGMNSSMFFKERVHSQVLIQHTLTEIIYSLCSLCYSPLVRPCSVPLVGSIICIVGAMGLAVLIYVKCKINITLFVRDTLGCYRSSSGLLFSFHRLWTPVTVPLIFFSFFFRWEDLRCVFDVLQEQHGSWTGWGWENIAEDNFGGQIWLPTLSLWSRRLTRELYVSK